MSLKIPPSGGPYTPVGIQYDHDRRLYWVPVSMELLPNLLTDWSEPVRVKIENGDMVFQRVEAAPTPTLSAPQGAAAHREAVPESGAA